MSSLINNYTKPTAMELRQDELHADTSVEEYDHNYIYDVVTLSSDRVELRPLVPSRDAKGLFEAFQAAPQLTDYLFDSYNTLEDVLRPIERYRRDPSFLYYAIYSARPGPNAHEEPKESYTLAGGLAIFRTSEEDQSAEIGHVTIFPEFQRTHVLTHAAGLLMHRILDDESLGGMNLRRCQWFTNSLNKPSQAAALRLGYTFEGILRSHRMLPVGKRGAHAGRKGEFEAQNSRDSWLSSVTWEEWEGGVRDHVDKLMSRRE